MLRKERNSCSVMVIDFKNSNLKIIDWPVKIEAHKGEQTGDT